MNEPSRNTIPIPAASNFLKIIDDKRTALYTLKNKQGMAATLSNDGCKLVSLLVPDNSGKLIDIITGTSVVQHTEKKTVGDIIWHVSQPNETTLELTCFSNHLDEDFSNNPEVKVIYTLSDDNRLKVSCEADSDKIRMARLMYHPFFNLNGAGSILNHIVQINADNFMTVDKELVSTGKIETVSATPFDFRKATAIGARINDNNEQLRNGKGYDHTFVINKHSARTPVARIKGDKSGILMELCTGEPGLQFYSGNLIKNKNHTKEDQKNGFRTAFVMETNYFPDPGNRPEFSATMFYPGQNYKSVTIYRFKTSK